MPDTMQVVSASQGPRITVNSILKQPLFVQAYLLDIADQLFPAEQLFRQAGNTPNGAVIYRASTGLFADSYEDKDYEEFNEVPTVITQLGTPKVAQAHERILGVEVSDRMKRRNDIDALNTQLLQVRNTLALIFNGTWMKAIDDAVIGIAGATHTIPVADGVWDDSTAVRKDFALAAKSITAEKRGFTPDTLLIDQSTYWNLFQNTDFWKAWVGGNTADQNPQITGVIPQRILGMRTVVTLDENMPDAGAAYLLQSKIFGGLSDEYPLSTTPWYRDEPRKVSRSDVGRSTAVFVDQPLAIAKIDGVRA